LGSLIAAMNLTLRLATLPLLTEASAE
jgi:hypothetical protein